MDERVGAQIIGIRVGVRQIGVNIHKELATTVTGAQLCACGGGIRIKIHVIWHEIDGDLDEVLVEGLQIVGQLFAYWFNVVFATVRIDRVTNF